MAELQKDGSIKTASTAPIASNDETALKGMGTFVDGVILSTQTRYFPGKNGKAGSVAVTYELSLNPGVARVEQFFSELDDAVSVKNGEVKEFPRLPRFTRHKFRVGGHKIFGGELTFTRSVVVL